MINDEQMRQTILYFALKYDGNFKKILKAIATKEKVSDEQLKETGSVRDSYITIIDSKYPQCLRNISCPPFAVFYDGNLKLMCKCQYSYTSDGSRIFFTAIDDSTSELKMQYLVACENIKHLHNLQENLKELIHKGS